MSLRLTQETQDYLIERYGARDAVHYYRWASVMRVYYQGRGAITWGQFRVAAIDMCPSLRLNPGRIEKLLDSPFFEDWKNRVPGERVIHIRSDRAVTGKKKGYRWKRVFNCDPFNVIRYGDFSKAFSESLIAGRQAGLAGMAESRGVSRSTMKRHTKDVPRIRRYAVARRSGDPRELTRFRKTLLRKRGVFATIVGKTLLVPLCCKFGYANRRTLEKNGVTVRTPKTIDRIIEHGDLTRWDQVTLDSMDVTLPLRTWFLERGTFRTRPTLMVPCGGVMGSVTDAHSKMFRGLRRAALV